ncbi:MAG: hypothetical protein RBT76_07355 [candidate division Zixibacteria bacterium]|jgi:hypothetical protein|nr:hypothetical protein [candidate division Zixibacteria bacterium]
MRFPVRTVLVTALVFVVVAVTVTTGHARNRFNVFSYQDPWEDACDSFGVYFAYMDTCGISHLENFNADSLGYYTGGTWGIKAYTKHWPNRVDQELEILPDLDLYNAMSGSANTRMAGANDQAIDGYLRSSSIVARRATDVSIQRPVLMAVVDDSSFSGMLHADFVEGVLHFIGKHLGEGHEVVYEAKLRLPDTSGSNGSVVAQLIFEYWIAQRSSFVADLDNSPYRVYRLNDTLLVRKENGQFVTYPTVDRTPSVGEKLVAINFPSSEQNPSWKDLREVTNVCYIANDTTYCTIPYRFVKDVYDTSFHNETEYHSYAETCVTKNGLWGDQYQYHYKVYWPNVKTVYLDSFYVYDDIGRRFDSLVYNHRSQVVNSIKAWYDDHEYAKGAVTGFYAFDESYGPEFQVVARVKDVTDAIVDDQYPHEVIGTLGAYNNTSAGNFQSQYYDTYVRYTNADFFMVDLYGVNSYYTSSSNPEDYTNVQCMVNWYRDRLAIVRDRAMVAPGGAVDFWIVVPVFDFWAKIDSVVYKPGRKPTQNELWMLVNLALCYGAKGIGYWPYLSDETEDPAKYTEFVSDHEKDPFQLQAPNCDDTPFDFATWCSLPSSECGRKLPCQVDNS